MKIALLLSLIVSLPLFAQDYKSQLTKAEYKQDVPDTFNGDERFPSGTVVEVAPKACAEEKSERALLRELEPGTPEFKTKLQKILKLAEICSVSVQLNDKGELVAFQWENDSKNNINPKNGEGTSRQYHFQFPERSKQNPHLAITDDSGLTGKLSHDLLETTIIFIPRKVLPYIEVNQESNECERKVILPTEEFVIFDALTKEIIAGVLKEAPMDMTESRHKRQFAGIEYTGNGIMIRADRRAGTPEHIYDVRFNVNEHIDKAVITRKGKTCLVKKDLIWENAHNPDKGAFFKYDTDQEFLDQVINPICGWDLTLSDLE
jgi:hypothetical protein